ncbi:hypothetical protein H6761_01980 [Candidatus Nomurabacteria bacterium]|nr:hypothetical protein [Candidatus Nomurabacteria bacterium]
MLEQIFSSLTRTKIIRFFCLHLDEQIFVRELTRVLGVQLNSVRRELDNLTKIGFLESENKEAKKFYQVNKSWPLLNELKNLIFKATTLEEMQVANKMSKVPGLQLLILTGVLTGVPTQTDVLIVGKVNKTNVLKYLEKIAEGVVGNLRYTFLTKQDYFYRLEVTDKFIYDILSHENIVVIDKMAKEIKNKQLDDFNFKHFRQ